MKKLVLFSVALLTFCLLNADLMQPVNPLIEQSDNASHLVRERNRQEIPEFSFNIAPVNIMASWYDYFPGSYESIPIRIQPSPAGPWAGGGVYVAFQAIPSAGAVRRVYYAYIEDGAITSGPSLINLAGTAAEGFPGIDIDPVTGDPFVSWHTASPNNPDFFHCPITFDQYSLIGAPGLWNTPYTVIDNPYDIGPEEDQEFIWPSVFIGPSPNAGQRRVYVVGKNYVSNLSGFPCENSLIAFADFTNPTDLAAYNEDHWTSVTIPQLDDWRQVDLRPFRATITSKDEGKIAIVGHLIQLDDDTAHHPDEILFVLENNNYGEGDWTLYSGDPTIPVANPIDPATGQGYFIGEGNQPYQDLRYSPYVNRHNAVLDDQGNYHFVAVYSLSTEEQTWFPNMTVTKHVKFQRDTQEFSINDLYPRDEDVIPYLPWGDPPVFDSNGFLEVDVSFPYYWYSADDVFHENYHRMIQHGPYMIALFQESIKARMFHEFGDDQYAAWASVPETYIMLSANYGESWTEPIVLNSIDTPELSGMIPAYWYIADDMEHLHDDWYRIHLLFYDQNDYGSFIQGNSPNTGGNIMYTSMDIDFSLAEGLNVDEEQLAVSTPQMLRQNYPNPFNPSTTISYNLPQASQVSLEIYNVKGQLVKTLVDGIKPAGENIVVWNGTDNSERSVSSGVYFYRLTTDTQTEMRKMLLVK